MCLFVLFVLDYVCLILFVFVCVFIVCVCVCAVFVCSELCLSTRVSCWLFSFVFYMCVVTNCVICF